MILQSGLFDIRLEIDRWRKVDNIRSIAEAGADIISWPVQLFLTSQIIS